ncbi:MAG: hypothetical protein KAI47_08205 [Deltaproteobacteria bacterium]|nr:hypothetical protein [Deltaproteobacteria bacterium]
MGAAAWSFYQVSKAVTANVGTSPPVTMAEPKAVVAPRTVSGAASAASSVAASFHPNNEADQNPSSTTHCQLRAASLRL